MLRLAPALALLVLLGPVACGLIATFLPAFGYLPSLGGNEFTTRHFHDVLQVGGMARSLSLSYFTGLATTLIAFVIVWLFVAGWYGTAMFSRMQHLISPLLSVPHAAAAFGLAFLIAPSGMLLRVLSPWATGFDRPPDWLLLQDPNGIALIAGLVVKEIPFLLLVTLAALPQTPAAQAARVAGSMGYGRIAGFTFATWPLVYRQIRLAVFAVIAFATSTVDVALVLGPATPPTLAVKLTQWMSDPDIALRFTACAGALLQLGVTMAAILTWIAGERIIAAVCTKLRNGGARFVRDATLRATGATLTGSAAFTVFAGLAMLALWSVSGFWSFPDALPGSYNLRSWSRTLPQLSGPLVTTLATGLIATAIAVVLTLACLEREARTGRTGGNRALLFIYIPLLIPQVAFVFGLQLFFLGLGWDASFPALVFVHLIFVLPYVFLALSDPWRAYDKRFVWLSAGLGQSPTRTFWRVRFPMLLKPVLVAAAVGLAVSIGQYLPTLLIGAGRWPTVTTEAVALASGGNRRVIGVMAFVQMVLPFIGFALAAAIPALLFRKRRGMGLAA
ncbi:MAG: ABC transporter permease subunit [Pseudomonadota bacterium]